MCQDGCDTAHSADSLTMLPAGPVVRVVWSNASFTAEGPSSPGCSSNGDFVACFCAAFGFPSLVNVAADGSSPWIATDVHSLTVPLILTESAGQWTIAYDWTAIYAYSVGGGTVWSYQWASPISQSRVFSASYSQNGLLFLSFTDGTRWRVASRADTHSQVPFRCAGHVASFVVSGIPDAAVYLNGTIGGVKGLFLPQVRARSHTGCCCRSTALYNGHAQGSPTASGNRFYLLTRFAPNSPDEAARVDPSA